MSMSTQPDTAEVRDRIAANLSAEMKRKRWSGRAMATALGLTQPYIARRASGEVECSGSDLELFADFLDVPVSAFFAKPARAGGAQIIGLTALRRGWGRVGRTGLEPVTDGL